MWKFFTCFGALDNCLVNIFCTNRTLNIQIQLKLLSAMHLPYLTSSQKTLRKKNHLDI